MKHTHISEHIERSKRPAVVQPAKEIKWIRRRIMRTLLKRKTGTKTRQIKRKLRMQSDATSLCEHRTIDKSIIAKRRVELPLKQHRQKTQGNKGKQDGNRQGICPPASHSKSFKHSCFLGPGVTTSSRL